jgi:hypothetical protein
LLKRYGRQVIEHWYSLQDDSNADGTYFRRFFWGEALRRGGISRLLYNTFDDTGDRNDNMTCSRNARVLRFRTEVGGVSSQEPFGMKLLGMKLPGMKLLGITSSNGNDDVENLALDDAKDLAMWAP